MCDIEAVLFDMDGVLLESEQYISRAGMLMFREKGYKVTQEDFIEFTGMGENRYLGGVAEKFDIPFNPEQDKARTYKIYEELVKGRIQPLPGVKSFIRKCRQRNLLIAVATSADRIKLEINLKEIAVPITTFDAIVSGEEIVHKKPSPDIFLKAAERLGVNPAYCLVVEDALSGVTAGKAAGAKVLALTTTFGKEELSEADWVSADLSRAPEEVLMW